MILPHLQEKKDGNFSRFLANLYVFKSTSELTYK